MGSGKGAGRLGFLRAFEVGNGPREIALCQEGIADVEVGGEIGGVLFKALAHERLFKGRPWSPDPSGSTCSQRFAISSSARPPPLTRTGGRVGFRGLSAELS